MLKGHLNGCDQYTAVYMALEIGEVSMNNCGVVSIFTISFYEVTGMDSRFL